MKYPTILIAQLNYITEDPIYNFNKILQHYKKALALSADLAVFSRFAIPGYLENKSILIGEIIENCKTQIKKLTLETQNKKTSIILGSISYINNLLHETIYFIKNGSITNLISTPFNSNIADETIFTFDETKISLLLLPEKTKVITNIQATNSDIVLLLDKSYHYQNVIQEDMLKSNIHNKLVLYINQIGGYNSSVFAGQSFALYNKKITSLLLWNEDSEFIDTKCIEDNHLADIQSGTISSQYQALMLSLKDYVYKNNFNSVLLGLSGGIDSALVATITSDALGADNVTTLMMPTKYTSITSIEDAAECAKKLGIKNHYIIPIEPILNTALKSLESLFLNHSEDITEENLQARIRGLILMAISNKFKKLLLATGNKTEFSVGYATIYGDMCGGFAPIKDIYKTQVYELSKWRNHNIPENSLCNKVNVIPLNIIYKAPSAELRYNQTDQDTLPDYSTLDEILRLLIEQQKSSQYIVSQGYRIKIVDYVVNLVKKSEFKRQQSPIGPKMI